MTNEQLLKKIEKLEAGQNKIIALLESMQSIEPHSQMTKEGIQLLMRQCNGDGVQAIDEWNRRKKLEMGRARQ